MSTLVHQITSSTDKKLPVSAHISELKKSVIICAIAVAISSGLAFVFFTPLLALFQAPINQRLYYTTPMGGISFLLKLCTTVGIVAVIPVIVNRMFSFIKPAVSDRLHHSLAWYSFFSVLLAIVGMSFAYLVSMPAALHFLTDFQAGDIRALISVDSYFSFFTAYLIGYALLFQTPIIMLFINKIKPLDPGDSMKYQKQVIGGSFIVAAILTPTPDPANQALMAIPIIVLYQVGIVLVWMVNRKTRRAAKAAQSIVEYTVPEPTPELQVAPQPVPELVTPQARRLILDIIPPKRHNAL